MLLIVGLGNPGKQYEKSRHNIGFIVLDELAKKHNETFTLSKKFIAETVKISINGKHVHLLKPQTFMNNSGESIKAIINYYNIEIENIVIIYDDKDMEFGKIRERRTGSSGGHNGMKSIVQHLKTKDFNRIKIGIANPILEKQNTADFVLSNFNKEEQKKLPDIIEGTLNLINKQTSPVGG